MKVFVIVEASYSPNGNVYYVTIVASFRTEAGARGFIKEKGWSMEPLEPNTSFYRIKEEQIRDGSSTVSFLRYKNSQGYLNDPRVCFQKNDALVEKMRFEYQKWKANEFYIINSDVDFHEVIIQ